MGSKSTPFSWLCCCCFYHPVFSPQSIQTVSRDQEGADSRYWSEAQSGGLSGGNHERHILTTEQLLKPIQVNFTKCYRLIKHVITENLNWHWCTRKSETEQIFPTNKNTFHSIRTLKCLIASRYNDINFALYFNIICVSCPFNFEKKNNKKNNTILYQTNWSIPLCNHAERDAWSSTVQRPTIPLP